jgi:hypothetical protein
MKLVAADVLYREAWWYRGDTATAADVSADNWAEFETRINQAERALLEALDLDPTCPEIPRAMICIENIQDRGRDRMEKWFEQAMQANSDDYLACVAKLQYLEPRWHGSEAEMLAFGRACQRTGNYDGRLPFVLLEVHLRLSAVSLTRPYPFKNSYFARPFVWQDIQSIYEPYLAGHPNSHLDKTYYAMLATLGGHYEVANRLFNELGENYWKEIYPLYNCDSTYLRDAARKEGINLEPPRKKPAGGGGGFRFGGPGQRGS